MEEFLIKYFTKDTVEFIMKSIWELLSIGTITTIITIIYKFISNLIKKSCNNTDLYPFYNNRILKDVRKTYIRTKCQNLDPSVDINYKSSFAFAVKEDLLDFFLTKIFKIKNIENKFYLILADSGMGKSTFMFNLFYKFNSLRNILFSKTKIKLLPLGEKYQTIIETINSIDDKKNTILLLDALDEAPMFITNEEINTKFNELIELVKDFKIVIITCRTHFFSKEKDEPFELKIKRFNTNGNGFHLIKKLYISPFDDTDIKKYINKTFNFFEQKKKEKANKIISNANDLFIRPMLLSYIKDLVIEKRDLHSNFDIYESLINTWVEREANKYPINEKEIFKFKLYKFSYEIATYIYNNYTETGLFVKLDIATELAKSNDIELSSLEIKSRTLLNRNSEGSYKFSHKSIYEFFIAYLSFISRDFNKNHIYTLKYNLGNIDQAKKFLEELQLNYKTDFLLPNYSDEIETKGIEIASKVFKEKYKNKPNIVWLSENEYRVE